VFFQKRAGRSVRYDRRVRNAEAAGSNPARSTKLKLTPNCGGASVVSGFVFCNRLIANFRAFSQVFEMFKPISRAKFVVFISKYIVVYVFAVIAVNSK
jgi:hypothetical protein